MELVTIAVAARRLGLSRASVRRRLASGELTGRQVPRPQGSVWLVSLPAAGGTSRDVPANGTSHGTSHDVTEPAARLTDQAPGAATLPNLAQRAEDMARYSAALLAPLHAQLAAQAERIGRLESELAMAKAGDHGGDPRPWWRFWWR